MESSLTGCHFLFLSTSPVWGTTYVKEKNSCIKVGFLSTSPVWGTTKESIASALGIKGISIHVPRVGDDSSYKE